MTSAEDFISGFVFFVNSQIGYYTRRVVPAQSGNVKTLVFTLEWQEKEPKQRDWLSKSQNFVVFLLMIRLA